MDDHEEIERMRSFDCSDAAARASVSTTMGQRGSPESRFWTAPGKPLASLVADPADGSRDTPRSSAALGGQTDQFVALSAGSAITRRQADWRGSRS